MGYLATINDEGKRTRGDISEGDRFVYVGPRNHWFSVAIVEESVEGEDIAYGTVAMVVTVMDYDYPFILELEDGRLTRLGNLHRFWNREHGPGVGDIVKMVDGQYPGELGSVVEETDVTGVTVISRYRKRDGESWLVYCHRNEFVRT